MLCQICTTRHPIDLQMRVRSLHCIYYQLACYALNEGSTRCINIGNNHNVCASEGVGVFMRNECHSVVAVGLKNVNESVGRRCLGAASNHSLSCPYHCSNFSRQMGVIINQRDAICFALNIETPCNTLKFAKHLSNFFLSSTKSQCNGKCTKRIEHIMHTSRPQVHYKATLAFILLQNIWGNVNRKGHATCGGFNV